MSGLRKALAERLARKVDAHGLVVWNDDAQEYGDAAASVCPADGRFEAYSGSWYELRRRIDDAISGDHPPRLVVYAPARPPGEDPLAEVRRMSSEVTFRLATLIRQSLSGQLPQTRLETLARTATSLSAAEQAMSGDQAADVRLITALGSSDTTAMLLTVLTGARDRDIDAANAEELVVNFVRETVGVELTSEHDRQQFVFMGMLLSDIALALHGPPAGPLETATPGASQRQKDRSRVVLRQLLTTPRGTDAYKLLGTFADSALGLGANLTWDDRLAELPGTAAIDHIAFVEAVRRFGDDDRDGAAAIAAARLAVSPWSADPTSESGPRWRVVEAMTWLHNAIDDSASQGGTVESQLRWYTEGGFEVDRAHRRLELARTTVGALGDLDPLLTRAREKYDTWLNTVLEKFTDAVAQHGLDVGKLLRQGEIHDRFLNDGDRTAYIWVDALRLELGHDLVDALQHLPASTRLLAAISAVPTITPVGMAALLPSAAESLTVSLAGDDIEVSVSNLRVKTVADRVALLRARHGTVADLDLNDAANRSEQALHDAIDKASIVLIRSQEVDAVGETDMLAAAWSTFSTVNQLLATVVTRLAAAGTRRVVVTADHGFIALSQGIGTHRVVEPPKGAVGVLKRRSFVGHGGIPATSTIQLPLPDCGVTSDCEITVPRGLAVFRAGGARQFFHGGLSPQELVVPVLIIDLAEPPTSVDETVRLEIAGGRITTGVFAVTITFDRTLFADRAVVRPVASRRGVPVARVVSGDGVGAGSDSVTLSGDRPSVLTFQVTANLAKGDRIDLHVLDAATGRTLAKQTASVAAAIIVEDDLG